MPIIPVIDLRHGLVVRAVRGERRAYLPIDSPLCGSAEPLAVAHRLCEHCATTTLYLADLDALQGGPVQTGVIAALLRGLPAAGLWLDAGFRDRDAIDALRYRLGADAARVTPVLASEALASRAALARCREAAPQAPLSLDRRGAATLDPAGLWDAPSLWPDTLIVMTLDRVGSAGGPDLDTLAAVRARAPQARLIGAGGLRDAADLAACAAAGAAGWLVASALHNGGLSATDCRAYGRAGHTLWQPPAGLHKPPRRTDNGICLA